MAGYTSDDTRRRDYYVANGHNRTPTDDGTSESSVSNWGNLYNDSDDERSMDDEVEYTRHQYCNTG